MRPFLPACGLLVALVLRMAGLAAADEQRPPPSAEEVSKAIERGVTFLKRQQSKKGDWADNPTFYNGGLTPLCVLALLQAGGKPDDEAVQKGLTFLRGMKAATTYTVALQTMALCAAEPKRDLALISRNVRWLETNQFKEGDPKGTWSYPSAGAKRGDNSNTHFALMALYEAEKAEVHVSKTTWQLARDYWATAQNEDGSWGYLSGHPGTGSMTCAGISSLCMAELVLAKKEAKDTPAKEGGPDAAPHRDAVRRGQDWLGANFSVQKNPGSPQWLFYYLHDLALMGQLTGQRTLNEHDWYVEGARMLVEEQGRNGAWGEEAVGPISDSKITTSFALLFLSRGKKP